MKRFIRVEGRVSTARDFARQAIWWLLALGAVALTVACQQDRSPAAGGVPVSDALARVKQSGVLTWGADVIGGVPYVFEDPDHKGTYIGFEVDLAQAIASHLGVDQKMVIRAWDALIPELQKRSFDMAMNGIEDLEERGKIVLFSSPYYVYAQQITVSRDTKGVATLSDLKGKRVATLSGSAAEDILRSTPGIEVRIHPEIVYSYRDLEAGKVDAVLLDTPIAAAYGAANSKLKNVGESFGQGRYVIAFRKADAPLREAINEALAVLKKNGDLRRIYQRWGLMDRHQGEIGVL